LRQRSKNFQKLFFKAILPLRVIYNSLKIFTFEDVFLIYQDFALSDSVDQKKSFGSVFQRSHRDKQATKGHIYILTNLLEHLRATREIEFHFINETFSSFAAFPIVLILTAPI